MQGSITSQEGRACQSSAIICFRQAAGLQSDCPSAFPWCHIALYLSTVPKFPRHLIIPILARCVSDRLSFNFSISISLGKVKIFSNHFGKNLDVYTNPSMFLLFSRKVVSDSATPWTVPCQAPLSSTVFWNLLEFVSIESVMPSNNFVLCRPLLLLPSIFPSIRVFSNEPTLYIRWPKYWSFSFHISPSSE